MILLLSFRFQVLGSRVKASGRQGEAFFECRVYKEADTQQGRYRTYAFVVLDVTFHIKNPIILHTPTRLTLAFASNPQADGKLPLRRSRLIILLALG